MVPGRSSVSEILCEMLVCNLFGIFEDLHGVSIRLCLCSFVPCHQEMTATIHCFS